MSERVGWDQYETALLIEACLLESSKAMPKTDLVHTLSKNLRNRATRNGRTIDELFRNENGISLQMTKMNYLLTDGTKGLPGASKFFAEMATLWKTDKVAFNKILAAAKEQISGERVKLEVMKSNKEKFQEWLREQDKLKLSPEHIISTIEEASKYALSHSVSKVAFFDIDDPKAFSAACTKLLSQRIFRLMHKQTAQNLDKCQGYYKSFLGEIECKETTIPPEVLTNIHDDNSAEKSATVSISNTPEEKASEPALKDGITVSDKLYVCLKDNSDKNQYGITLFYLAKLVGADESVVKRLLDKAEWASLEYGRYKFNYASNQGRQQYDFETPQSLAFSRPVSVSYFGDIITKANSWKQALVDTMHVLYDDYPHVIEEVRGKLFGTATIPLVAGEDQISLMRVPKEFAKGLYVETNRSASDIMANLKRIIDACNIDYENIIVLFERKDNSSGAKDVQPTEINTKSEISSPVLPESPVAKTTTITTTEEAYSKWLQNSCGLADATARSYVSAIHSAELYAKQHRYSEYQIYGDPKETALAVISDLLRDPDFIRYNQEQHNRFSASFKKFSAFLEEDEKSTLAAADDVSVKYPQLYSKLYAASKVYDTPEGMNVSRICALVGSDEAQKVSEILRGVPWATEVETDKFSFSKKPVIKTSDDEPHDFDQEKYITILLQRYRSGMTFDSIDFDIFREIYEDTYDEQIVFDDAALEKRLKYCGVIYKDRLFPAEGVIDNETKSKLYSYIESNFASGKNVLYYKAIFEDLSDAFASCYTLSDEGMLKAFILFTAPKGKYYFSENYMSVEKNVQIDHSAEIADYLLSAGKPMSREDICAALSHIPQDKVNQIISVDSRFLRNAKGEFFHRDIFEISADELDRIAGYIGGCIEENEYAIWTDIWEKIQDEMTIFLENNLYLSSLGVRNAIGKLYAGRFNFNGAVISETGKNYEMRDIYQLFAKHHSTFTSDEIYDLSKELDTVIYFEALSAISVRVSHDLFVSKKRIDFDVEAIDKAIASFIAGDYIRIREIDSFLAFPNVGYEWNEYLLESFLKSYSKKYMLLNNGSALHNVAGAIVKRKGSIQEFVDACAVVLADSHVDLKKDLALNYLAEVNMITQRRYKDIDIALQKAKQMRAQKG